MNIGDNGTEDDDNNNVAVSQETICSDPYCNCLCHKKEGDSPPPPPPPPPEKKWEVTMAKAPHNMLGGRTIRCNFYYIRRGVVACLCHLKYRRGRHAAQHRAHGRFMYVSLLFLYE